MRDYQVQQFENCQKDLPMLIDFKMPKSNLGEKYPLSGMLVILEKISGPISLSLENSRCDLEMKNCGKGTNFNLKEVCKTLINPSPKYSNIEPPLKCPIESGNYTIKPMEVDLKLISLLPIDGYIHTTTVKLSGTLNGKPKKVVFCMKGETKIVKVRASS